MNIQEIKTQLQSENPNGNFSSLQMVQQKDSTTSELQPWFSYWCNKSRTRVTMHQDVFSEIQKKRDINTLVLKDGELVAASGDRAEYTRYIIVIPTNIADVF
jgi:hypothetical protein